MNSDRHFPISDPWDHERSPIEKLLQALPDHCYMVTNFKIDLRKKRPELDVMVIGYSAYLIDLTDMVRIKVFNSDWELGSGKIIKCKYDVINEHSKQMKSVLQQYTEIGYVDEFVALTNRFVKCEFGAGQIKKKKKILPLSQVIRKICDSEENNRRNRSSGGLDWVRKFMDDQLLRLDRKIRVPDLPGHEVVSERKWSFWDQGVLLQDAKIEYRYRCHNLSFLKDSDQLAEANEYLSRLRQFRETQGVQDRHVKVFDVERIDEEHHRVWHLFKNQEDDVGLSDWLQGDPPLEAKVEVVQGLLRGLEAIHSVGIVHRNICSDSVRVLEKNTLAYISNFELARDLSLSSSAVTVISGQLSDEVNKGWWSPEAHDDAGKLTEERSDCYSFGLLCRLIFSGLDPANESTAEREQRLQGEGHLELPESVQDRYPQIEAWISALLRVNPVERRDVNSASLKFQEVINEVQPSRELTSLSQGDLVGGRYKVASDLTVSEGSPFRVLHALDAELGSNVILKYARNRDVECQAELQKEQDNIIHLRGFYGGDKIRDLSVPRLVQKISRCPDTGHQFFVRSFVETTRSDVGSAVAVDDFDTWIQCTLGVLAGIKELHRRDWYLRDVSVENVLVSAGMPFLIDVGSAIHVPPGQNSMDFEGKREYLPHFLVGNEPNAEKRKNLRVRDLFACLLTSFQWLAGEYPWVNGTVCEENPRLIQRPDLVPQHLLQVTEFFVRWIGKESVDRWKTQNVHIDELINGVRELDLSTHVDRDASLISDKGRIFRRYVIQDDQLETPVTSLQSPERYNVKDEASKDLVILVYPESDTDFSAFESEVKSFQDVPSDLCLSWSQHSHDGHLGVAIDVQPEDLTLHPSAQGMSMTRELLRFCERTNRFTSSQVGNELSNLACLWAIREERFHWFPLEWSEAILDFPISLAGSRDAVGLGALVSMVEHLIPDIDLDVQSIAQLHHSLKKYVALQENLDWKSAREKLQWHDVGPFYLDLLKGSQAPFDGMKLLSDSSAKGHAGEVFRVQRVDQLFVVKIARTELSDSTRESWQAEIDRIDRASELNLSSLASKWDRPETSLSGYVVMKAADMSLGEAREGSVYSRYFSSMKYLLDQSVNLARALYKLSEFGIYCTDLHQENIMISSYGYANDPEWVLVDFGEGMPRYYSPPEWASSGRVLHPPSIGMVYSYSLLLLETILLSMGDHENLIAPFRPVHHGSTDPSLDLDTEDEVWGSDEIHETDWDSLRALLEAYLQQDVQGSWSRRSIEDTSLKLITFFQKVLNADPVRRKSKVANLRQWAEGLKEALESLGI